MGTSQSSPGLNGKSPLIPSWVDDPQNTPEGVASEIRGFRKAISDYAKTGERTKLNRALNRFARGVTGGGQVASRRLANVTAAGATLYTALNQSDTSAVDINEYKGLPPEEAAAAIASKLAASGADADLINSAMAFALSKSLERQHTFDPSAIDSELLSQVLVNYFSESISIKIILSAGDRLNKSESPDMAVKIENDLRNVVWVIADKHMTPLLTKTGTRLSKNKIIEIENKVVAEVWNEWEALND